MLPPLPLDLPGEVCGTRLLVAVSGGCDSVALLHALVESGERDLVVCHYNHRLRGRASGGDARFVAALARKLGLCYEGGAGDVAVLAKDEGKSVELAAREARYRFFAEVSRRYNCNTLLLAHHADDQVETVIMNFFRGSGLAGLGGIRPDTTREIDGVALRLLRPLLKQRRSEIEAYAKARGIRWREDASNESLEHVRNRVRRELIPRLEELFGRNIHPTLTQLAEVAREEERWIAEQMPQSETEELSVKTLKAESIALQRRRLRNWLRGRGIEKVGFREVEKVRELLTIKGNGAARVNLPGGRFARRRAGVLFLE